MANWVNAAKLEQVPPGQCWLAMIGQQRIAIYNVDGELYATDDVCTHDEASLCEGTLDGDVIECPLHGARFNVRTGAVLALPAVVPVETFPVKVEGGEVKVRVE